MTALLIAVPIAPIVAALLVLLFGRKDPRGGAWLPVAGTAVSLMALLALPHAGFAAHLPWLTFRNLTINVGLRVDVLAWFMAILVTSIALLVNLYATEFMQSEEEGRPRFYALMALFASAMLTVVLSDSLVLLFAAWEIMGFTSWGLIGFWYREEQSRRSAQMAFLMTRVGDVGFLLGWLLIVTKLRTADIDSVLAAVQKGVLAPPVLTLVALLFFTAAIGKSAQLPLTAWLPEAMVGPTPVSGLIHSATMVAAGVYLVLRFYPLFQAAPGALTAVLWVGAVTALLAALVATTQADLKRILAWSTISQLGEMMIALGLAGPVAAFYHLVTHAVFKSGLFLAAGAVEDATGRKKLDEMGSIVWRLPVLASAFSACALALAGFPLLSGFWSEEKIIAAAIQSSAGWVLFMLVLIFFAGVYISRAAAGVFLEWPGAPGPEANKPGPLIVSATVLLAIGAATIGFAVKDVIPLVSPAQSSTGDPGWAWRLGAITASITGLSYGTWRVLTAGPVASFGRFPEGIASGLYKASCAPAQGIVWIGSHLLPERMLDLIVRSASEVAERIAGGIVFIDDRYLDRAARGTVAGVIRTAGTVDSLEIRGLDAGGTGLAHRLWKTGGRVRQLETGQVYVYTRAIFVWAIFAIALFYAIWR